VCVKTLNGNISQKFGLTFDIGRILIGVEGSDYHFLKFPTELIL